MLLRFRFSNFRSFRDEQELSLVASPLSEQSGSVIDSAAAPDGILPVAAIYGANASGKSNVLKALDFFRGAVNNSFNWSPSGPIPYDPYLLDESSEAQASRFVMDLAMDGVRYEYGFAADQHQIIAEWLHAFPHGRKQIWFSRKQGEPVLFGRSMMGENIAIERITRPNCLFLSAAAQANHQMLTELHRQIKSAIALTNRSNNRLREMATQMLKSSEVPPQDLGVLLGHADLGISGVTTKPYQEDSELLAFREKLRSLLPDPAREIFDSRVGLTRFEFTHYGRHRVPFAEAQESDGTLEYLFLITLSLGCIGAGQLLIIDELDRSLHPTLLGTLIRVFADAKLNTKGAQLIFATHDTNLLSSSLLRRDQIWFTEKDRTGVSHLYPLTDFHPRKGENLENGYLQGRYGAIPFLNAEGIIEAANPVSSDADKHGKAKAKAARKR